MLTKVVVLSVVTHSEAYAMFDTKKLLDQFLGGQGVAPTDGQSTGGQSTGGGLSGLGGLGGGALAGAWRRFWSAPRPDARSVKRR